MLARLTTLALVLSSALLCAHEEVSVETLAKSEKMWDGTSLPDFSSNATEITVLRITVPPHTKLPLHKHPVINVGYMLSGTLTVESETGATTNLQAGDALIELVNKWHFGRNDSDEPAVIVVVYLGEAGVPVSISKEAVPAPPLPSAN